MLKEEKVMILMTPVYLLLKLIKKRKIINNFIFNIVFLRKYLIQIWVNVYLFINK